MTRHFSFPRQEGKTQATNLATEYSKLLADSVAQFREKIIVSILPPEIRTDIQASIKYLRDNNACWMRDRNAPNFAIAEQFWIKGIHVGTLSANWDMQPGQRSAFVMQFRMSNFDALDTLPFADRLDSVRLQHLKEFAAVKGLSPAEPKNQHQCIIANCHERKLAPHLDFCYLHENEYQMVKRNLPPTLGTMWEHDRTKFAEEHSELFSRKQ